MRVNLFLAKELGLVNLTDDKIAGLRHRKRVRIIIQHPVRFVIPCRNYHEIITAK